VGPLLGAGREPVEQQAAHHSDQQGCRRHVGAAGQEVEPLLDERARLAALRRVDVDLLAGSTLVAAAAALAAFAAVQAATLRA